MDIFLIGIISYLMGSIPFGFILTKIFLKKDKLVSKSKNTSIEDKKLQGKVTNTFVKGKELFKL